MKSLPFSICFAALVLALPGQVLINELETGNIDALEIVNLGSAPVDLTGWRVEYGGPNAQLAWTPGTFNFPAGFTLAPEGAVVLSESTTVPTMPAGVTRFTGIQNINWATSGGTQTRGGAAILVDATGAGVDMVIFLNATPPNTFGATFTGSLTPTASAFGRNSRTDTNTPADWSSSSLANASFGLVNPSQVLPTNVFTLTLQNQGSGLLRIAAATSFPALPNAEVYNLASLQNLQGTGPVFGVGIDSLFVFQFPLDPANGLFHTALDANGGLERFVPGVPAGLHLEVVSVALNATGIARISNVAIIDF